MGGGELECNLKSIKNERAKGHGMELCRVLFRVKQKKKPPKDRRGVVGVLESGLWSSIPVLAYASKIEQGFKRRDQLSCWFAETDCCL